MHNFIRFVLIFSFCIILASCSNNDNIEKELIEQKSENYSISMENLSFGMGEEFTLNSDIKKDLEFWVSDFEERVVENKLKGTELPNMQIRHKIYQNNETIISMVTEKYAYINGAHGNIWWKARNFDVKNNTYLSLSDLFYDDEYKKMLNLKMEELINENPKKYHDLWEKPEIKGNSFSNFYIDKKTLVIFFEPYELSFYAKGVVEFPIEASKLRGFIKEEYLKLMN